MSSPLYFRICEDDGVVDTTWTYVMVNLLNRLVPWSDTTHNAQPCSTTTLTYVYKIPPRSSTGRSQPGTVYGVSTSAKRRHCQTELNKRWAQCCDEAELFLTQQADIERQPCT